MKILKFFILIIISLGVLYGGFNAGVYSYVYYKKLQQNRALKKFQEEIKKQEEVKRQKLMTDTYGGKTPQETLRMFIDAIEKGDYELASKYFVEKKQKEWGKEIKEILVIKKQDVFLQPLKDSLSSDGEYFNDDKNFSIYKPVGIDFVLYPNSIWKLTDI